MLDRLKQLFRSFKCISKCCNPETSTTNLVIIKCASCKDLFTQKCLCMDCILRVQYEKTL